MPPPEIEDEFRLILEQAEFVVRRKWRRWDKDMVDDAVQEARIAAWIAFRSWTPEKGGDRRVWCVAKAVWASKDFMRDWNHQRAAEKHGTKVVLTPDGELGLDGVHHDPDIEDTVGDPALRAHVEGTGALNLSTFLLLYDQDMTPAEASLVLGIDINAMYQRHKTLRDAVRPFLLDTQRQPC